MQAGDLGVTSVCGAGRDRGAFLVDVSVTRNGRAVDGTIRANSEAVGELSKALPQDVAARILDGLSGHELKAGFSFGLVAVSGSNELLLLQPLDRRPLPKPERTN
jgi:hypothetical protein